MLENLQKPDGSTFNRKRIGRGPGSTFGKTSGKGHKGQNARSGNGTIVGFEGGQMPLHRRLPKRGFTNIFKKEYSTVNLCEIERSKKVNTDELITKEILVKAGIIRKASLPIRVLGKGEISKAIKIQADYFSKSALEKIQAAGGEAQLING
ncbi:MAG: large subunit ribosomal protein L15 [bacterium]|jgi:large subunit ribosomal protein L15